MLDAVVSGHLSVVGAAPKKRKPRFSLLLLEHGECFLYDFAVVQRRGGGGPGVNGRLKLCSRSLVFEPAETAAPLQKFALRAIAGQPIKLLDRPARIAFECGAVTEMMAEGRVEPFALRSVEGRARVFEFEPCHTSAAELHGLAERLRLAARRVATEGAHAEAAALAPLVMPLQQATFEMRQLVDYTEDILILPTVMSTPSTRQARCVLPAERVTPLLKCPGVFVATTKRLYFEPGALNNVGDSAFACTYGAVVHCRKARHMMQPRAIEFEATADDSPFSVLMTATTKRSAAASSSSSSSLSNYGGGGSSANQRRSLRVAFESAEQRDACWAALLKVPAIEGKILVDPGTFLVDARARWHARDLDNYGYLAALNHAADRSVQDLSQYPVFPWVLQDFDSASLDLSKPGTFRDLSKPIGALDPARLEAFLDRFQAMPRGGSGGDGSGGPMASPMDDLAALVGRASPSSSLKLSSSPPTVSQQRRSVRDIFASASSIASSATARLASNISSTTQAARDGGVVGTLLTVGGGGGGGGSGGGKGGTRSRSPPSEHDDHDDDDAEGLILSSYVGPAREAPFMFGTHYSTPGYVLFYLVRAVPEYMLCLQNGKFDSADRMFASVQHAWASVLSNSADLKELIPEFYEGDGDFLVNSDDVPLGTTQAGDRVGDVRLPPWARSPRDFVKKCRQALESDFVSAHLHEWIDLAFGAKQRGPAAEAARNLFHPLTYEGAVDFQDPQIPPRDRAALEMQVDEFGQTPTQLFVTAHPRRGDPDSDLEIIVGRRLGDVATTVPTTDEDPPKSAAASSSIVSTKSNKDPLRTTTAVSSSSSSSSSSSATMTTTITGLQLPGSSSSSSFPSAADAARPPPLPAASSRAASAPLPSPPTPTQQATSRTRSSSGSMKVARGALNNNDKATTDGAPCLLRGLAGTRTARLHKDAVTALAYASGTLASASRDGTVKLSSIVAGGSDTPPDDDSSPPSPLLTEMSPDKLFRTRRSFSASDSCVSCVALTADARVVFAGGWDNHVVAYAVESACLASRIEAHDASVSSLAFERDTLTTGAWDATVKLWRVLPTGLATAPTLELYDHESAVCAVVASKFGNLVAAAADDGAVLVWDARVGAQAHPGPPIGAAHDLPGDGAANVLCIDTHAGAERIFAARGSAISEIAIDGTLRATVDAAFDVRSLSVIRFEAQLYVVAGGDDAQLALYDARTLEMVFIEKNAHPAAIAAFATFECVATHLQVAAPRRLLLMPAPRHDGKPCLVSGADDCTVRVWSPQRR